MPYLSVASTMCSIRKMHYHCLNATATNGVSGTDIVHSLEGRIPSVAEKFPHNAMALSSVSWTDGSEPSEALAG
jgi:hypothetical protein